MRLPEHFLVGKDLAGIVATQLEKTSQQRRLIYSGQEQDVSCQGGLNQRIMNTPGLEFLLFNKLGGTWVFTERRQTAPRPS
jgi:hypothetical protein